MPKLIETKIAEMLDGGEPLAWAIKQDGRMKVIAHDGREYWFEAKEVAAARAAIERHEASEPAPNPDPQASPAPLPDPEPGSAPGDKPKPATAAKPKPATAARRSSSRKTKK